MLVAALENAGGRPNGLPPHKLSNLYDAPLLLRHSRFGHDRFDILEGFLCSHQPLLIVLQYALNSLFCVHNAWVLVGVGEKKPERRCSGTYNKSCNPMITSASSLHYCKVIYTFTKPCTYF